MRIDEKMFFVGFGACRNLHNGLAVKVNDSFNEQNILDWSETFKRLINTLKC